MDLNEENVAVALARHDERLKLTEKGVANFRAFTTTVEEFITRYDSNREANIEFQNKRDKENAVREARRWQLAGTILAVLSLLVGWLTYRDSQRKLSEQSNHPGVELSQPQDATVHTH
jgi:hypothetical protein